ncbi:MAG: beta-N-acetylhexosaminidase [Desulfocapsaceae bacterium]|nr:beta-N-acetylhexosaminidase [Desulfocapsaceae bacterium]
MAAISTQIPEDADIIGLIPKPFAMERLPGDFTLDPSTRIKASGDAIAIATYLKQLLQQATGYPLVVEERPPNDPGHNAILMTLVANGEIPDDEGYRLLVRPEGIVIQAARPAGLFYAVQTLRQLFPAAIERSQAVHGQEWTIPALRIEDKPRFKWRGMMLDTGRHTYPVEFIKRYIDLLALHKLNVFHWHLTDDQGWRIEIKKYPRLTEVGSRRQASPLPAEPERSDGMPYGGFFSQEQVADIVSHAAGRFVTVVPEIDMPGHSMAALASYPDLGCSKGPYAVLSRWGVNSDIYCAGKEKVYRFLEDVLTEVLSLFPSPVIHIGGDEVPKDRWKQCPRCQALIREKGLDGEDGLQGYFVRRIDKFLKSRGRRLIGWDEILDGGLPAEAIVMSWRGTEGGVKAALSGHEAVMCPMSHCYFDHRQSLRKEDEPPAIGDDVLLLEDVYGFCPVPEALPPQAACRVLGAQGNVWTEYMATSRQVEYMTFPRGTALAEGVWSPSGSKDFPDFMQRLNGFLEHLRELGVHFRDPFSKRRDNHGQ